MLSSEYYFEFEYSEKTFKNSNNFLLIEDLLYGDSIEYNIEISNPNSELINGAIRNLDFYIVNKTNHDIVITLNILSGIKTKRKRNDSFKSILLESKNKYKLETINNVCYGYSEVFINIEYIKFSNNI